MSVFSLDGKKQAISISTINFEIKRSFLVALFLLVQSNSFFELSVLIIFIVALQPAVQVTMKC